MYRPCSWLVLNRRDLFSDTTFFFLNEEIYMSGNFSWDMPNFFGAIQKFAFNAYCSCIKISFTWVFICFYLNLYFINFLYSNSCSILVDMISRRCNLCFKWTGCCLSLFYVLSCSCDCLLRENLRKRTHKGSNFTFFNSNAWL